MVAFLPIVVLEVTPTSQTVVFITRNLSMSALTLMPPAMLCTGVVQKRIKWSSRIIWNSFGGIAVILTSNWRALHICSNIFSNIFTKVSSSTKLIGVLNVSDPLSGPDYARARIQVQQPGGNQGDVTRYNEVDDYWTARYLSAGEAAWRLLGFNITSTTPAVSPLPVHIPASVRHTQYKRNDQPSSSMSLMLCYFHRPQGRFTFQGEEYDFEELKYMDYFRIFRLMKWSPNRVDGFVFFSENATPPGQPKMLVRLREEKNLHITRLAAAKPSEKDRFYIRVLLQHRPARSFELLRTVDGSVLPSFQHAAIALGLFVGEREAEYALQEAITTHLYTPKQLRRLFVDILINECTDTPLVLWERFRDQLSEDHRLRSGSDQHGLNRTLEDIGRQLEEYGRNLRTFGLPMPIPTATEVEHELQRWAPHIPAMRERAQRALRCFNADQQHIYDDIMASVASETPLLLFIDGKAGRGKTFLLTTICDSLRADAKIVIPTATSAFAAQLYPGGRTAHSTFKVCHDPFQQNHIPHSYTDSRQ
jgi:hypothetical protein